jgi:L-seryl-tRNA(Ser) seleniumtransferase
MITMTQEALQNRAEKLAEMLSAGLSGVFDVSTDKDVSRVGGGSLPLAELPTTVVSIKLKDDGKAGSLIDTTGENRVGANHAGTKNHTESMRSHPTINDIEAALRRNNPPIIVRIKEDALLLDPRTIQSGEEGLILAAFEKIKQELLGR